MIRVQLAAGAPTQTIPQALERKVAAHPEADDFQPDALGKAWHARAGEWRPGAHRFTARPNL